jgi:hypothetical protein
MMQLVRNATQQAVSLEDGFLWSDEFTWKPIEQNQEYAINGALIIQEGEKLSGRSIILEPANRSKGWIKLADLRTLREWSTLQEEAFTLKFDWPHDKRQFTVIFNHSAGALEAKPIKDSPAVSINTYFNVTMKFTEVDND